MDEKSLAELRAVIAQRPRLGLPVFLALAERMERLIRDGVWEDSMRLPPDSVLAEKIGISHITLAKSLNELRKKELAQRSRSLGTFVCAPKENIRGTSAENSRKIVALLLDDVNSRTIRSEFISTLLRLLEEAGIGFLFQSAGNRPQQQYRQLLDAMVNPDCHGALIWSIFDNETSRKALARKPAYWPIVFMNESPAMEHREHDAVVYDGSGAAFQIGDDFFAGGGREILLLTADWRLHYESIRCRFQGFWQAAARHGLPAENVKVMEYREKNIPLDRLMPHGDNRLLVFATEQDLTDTLAGMAAAGIGMDALKPWIGIGHSLSEFKPDGMPMYLFDSQRMAFEAVNILRARLQGSQKAFKDIKVTGQFANKQGE